MGTETHGHIKNSYYKIMLRTRSLYYKTIE